MMVYILIFLLVSVIICLSVIIYYSLNRINRYELLIEEIYNIIDFMNKRLKILDNSGHFEADDEVGFFFSELKRLYDILNNIFENSEEEENGDEAKEEE
jgi:hypothetical protein